MQAHLPVSETSPNGKGLYPEGLALLLTSLTGGSRFSPVAWGRWVGSAQGLLGVDWLPQQASVLTRLLAKFYRAHNERLRRAAVGLVVRLRVLAIPAQYGSGGRQPRMLSGLGGADRSLRSKIVYWLERIKRLGLSLLNCNPVGPAG